MDKTHLMSEIIQGISSLTRRFHNSRAIMGIFFPIIRQLNFGAWLRTGTVRFRKLITRKYVFFLDMVRMVGTYIWYVCVCTETITRRTQREPQNQPPTQTKHSP